MFSLASRAMGALLPAPAPVWRDGGGAAVLHQPEEGEMQGKGDGQAGKVNRAKCRLVAAKGRPHCAGVHQPAFSLVVIFVLECRWDWPRNRASAPSMRHRIACKQETLSIAF